MKSDRILVVIAATTLLTIAATTAAIHTLSILQHEAAAQNTTMDNQTMPPMKNQTMTNQTEGGATAAVTANLTQADFESVIDNLNSASEALQANDTTEAYDVVNSVENELFEIATDQGQNMKTLMQIFKPLQDSIDSARDALRNNDTAKALQQLNSTNAELLKVTQQPPVEGEQEEDEEETEE
jgi:hypothetical protein